MNVYAGAPSVAPPAVTARQGVRVASLCGSIKPLFSGTDDFHENLVSVLREKTFDVRPVDRVKWGLTQVPDLLRQVAAERPDVILLQYPTDAFNASLGPHAFCLLQRQAPLVVTLHEFSAANPIRRASLSVLLARADAVVMTSDRERDALLSSYPWLKPRTLVIPIGSNFPACEWRPEQPPMVAYFGQIRPEKGLEAFIACRDLLAPRFPQARFVICGSRVPKFASYAATIEASCLNRGITLRGEMRPADVSGLLGGSSVALLPFPTGASFRRGSLLAAAVCGVPIVTLSGGETPSEITRLLAPVSSQEAMVAQVTQYLADPGALVAAHEKSCELASLVSWDAIGDQYAGLFVKLAARAA